MYSNWFELFSRICEVFNEMEMKINVIDKKKIHKITFKNKSKRKRNFIYHFLVKIKPHEKKYLLITASVNIYQTKNVFQ